MAKVINCTIGNMDDAIAECQRHLNDIERKCEEFVRRVGDELGSLIKSKMSGAIADIYKDRDGAEYRDVASVKDPVITSEGNVCIVAVPATDDAIFIEFGTGVFYNGTGSPHPKGAELGYTIGSYGPNGLKKTWWFSKNGMHSLRSHGIPALMPIYKAAREIEPKIASIAREVFG